MFFLVTDYCFLTVLLVCVILFGFSFRHKHTRIAWQRLLQKPLAVSAGMVFLCFLTVGILDSIHAEWSYTEASGVETRRQTVLEHVLYPLGSLYEQTYSAPLSLHLHHQDVVILDNGTLHYEYPLLKYSKPFFKNAAERNQWVVQVLCGAAIVALLLALVLYFVVNPRLFVHFNALVPTLTLFGCIFLTITLYCLSRKLHVLGTGKIGQDIFYYTIKSIRTGLVIGILTTLFMLPFALVLGVCAGYFGGRVDDLIQYVYTTLSSIPGVLLITASVLSMQTYIANHPEQFTTLAQSADARLLALCLILGVTSWTSLCRILRAEALKWRELDFVQAAKVLGSSSFTILRKHLLPNMIPIIIITLVLDFSFLVMAEAVLSYVGVGVSPLTISWGNMINGARLELARDPVIWWPIGAAFIFMFTLVLVSNLLVDALRDAFEPG